MRIEFECPRPPSINALWVLGRGRMYKSNEYRRWLKDMAGYLQEQGIRAGSISGTFGLTTLIAENRADLDNVASKAILDMLQHYGIIGNDKGCRVLTARYSQEAVKHGCKVIVEEFHEDPP